LEVCHGRPSRATVAHVVVVVSGSSNNKTISEESALSCKTGEVDSMGTGGYSSNIELRVYEWEGVIEVIGRLRSRCKRGRTDIMSLAWNWNSLHHFL